MNETPIPLYEKDDIVYIYGIEEYEARVISRKYTNNTWFYIVQFTENQQCAVYSEDSLFRL